MNLFIDTNVLLLFYHLGSDDLEELKKLIELIKQSEIKLIVTQQVLDEFYRNRESKLKDAFKRLSDFRFNPSIPSFCKHYPEYEELTALLKRANEQHSKLINSVKHDASSNSLKADGLIEQLFQLAGTIRYDDDIYRRALMRVKVGNPPGKAGSIGDAINWECMLRHTEPDDDLHLVSGDADYVSALDSSNLNEFLKREWRSTRARSDLHFYRTISEFFKQKYPNIQLADDVEKDILIDKLSRSSSFRETHQIAGKLLWHTEFSPIQIDRLVSIPYSNSQMGSIISDPDLRGLYSSLFRNHATQMTRESREKFAALMAESGLADAISNAVF